MIQFSYQPHQVVAAPQQSLDLVYRPMADIHLIGPKGFRQMSAPVDTGADETLFPVDLADRLGVELRDEDSTLIRGIEGSLVTIWYATVNLEILTSGGGPRWSARVGFYLGTRPILGHAGFLDHFTARFNGRAKTLTLTPNGTAPAAVHLGE